MGDADYRRGAESRKGWSEVSDLVRIICTFPESPFDFHWATDEHRRRVLRDRIRQTDEYRRFALTQRCPAFKMGLDHAHGTCAPLDWMAD